MNRKNLQFGPWEVEALPDDGGRLSRLRFAGVDLLTRRPIEFHPPLADYGQYETRPVYGYDDCFPTVDACQFPTEEQLTLADHGELCWLNWEVTTRENRLECAVQSRSLPLEFRRSLVFSGSSLDWEFQVTNKSDKAIPFLHVMHALMPLEKVTGIALPECSELFDEIHNQILCEHSAADVVDQLLNSSGSEAKMLLLRRVESGRLEVILAETLQVTIEFPSELFPTLGIWWNNAAYPSEDGSQRVECAFEPMPGTASSLATSYQDGVYLEVGPQDCLEWKISWRVSVLADEKKLPRP